MEPMIRKMIEMGMLTDKNGEKFTDLSQIPFAEGMTQGFDKVEAAMKEMQDYSERRVRAAIAQAPKGTFYGEDAVDDDGLTDDPLVVKAWNAGLMDLPETSNYADVSQCTVIAEGINAIAAEHLLGR